MNLNRTGQIGLMDRTVSLSFLLLIWLVMTTFLNSTPLQSQPKSDLYDICQSWFPYFGALGALSTHMEESIESE